MKREPNGINDQQACSYLTFNVVDWVDVFIRPVYKGIIVETLNQYVDTKGLIVYAWCLMTNHLHLVVKAQEVYGTAYIERDFKKETAKKILAAIGVEPDPRRQWMLERFANCSQTLKLIEKFNLWQSSSHPTYINCNNEALLTRHIRHVHENPVRDGIVEHAEDYLYSSARDYAGMPGLVKVKRIRLFDPQLPNFDKLN